MLMYEKLQKTDFFLSHEPCLLKKKSIEIQRYRKP